MQNIGKIQEQPITKEMQKSYLDYAMSVIISRALPDIRDGLKPVQRRILYAMYKELGVRHGGKFVKSARIVGETMGKYHPHGDSSIYEAMVRLAQDFSLRYPLITGQGNFGSVDGDAAAAPRYTEAKMSKLAEDLLADIEKDTVDFRSNYDDSRQEPSVLPSQIPNLLINGTLGIAVGMATNIPPHNLGEIIDGLIYLSNHKNAGIEDLLTFIQGPDFPTGGTIYNKKDILNAYATGRGGVIMRAVTDIEETKRGGYRIIVSEIPFQVNKAVLIEKIAGFVRNKKLEGIRDIRDESDKEGLRIVIELKQDAYPKKVLNYLFKYTDLQKTFHFNMVALIDGIQPKLLNLKSFLEHFLEHRKIVVRRRTQFDLARAKERAHILEGLKKAIDHIDAVIRTIKKSASRDDAFKNLIKKFKFSEAQTNAILDLRLQSLAGLEQKRIEDELKEKKKLIARLEELLKSPRKMLQVIRDELKEVKEKYGDKRRTKVIKTELKDIDEESLVPEEDSLFVMTNGGYIKRMSPTELRSQRRGGKGLIGMTTREDDMVTQFFLANTHDHILFFTNSGKVFRIRGYEVPEGKRTSRGRALVNFLEISNKERVTALVPIAKDKRGNFLFMGTHKGIVKRVKIQDFEKVRRTGMIAISLKEGDELGWVSTTSGEDEIVMITNEGNAIRFREQDVRSMGRTASGVTGIRLSKQALVQTVGVVRKGIKPADRHILVITENGYGKRTKLSKYKVQKRGGVGLKTVKITSKTGALAIGRILTPENEEIIIISRKGQLIRMPIRGISILGRATQGVRVMKLARGDRVVSVVIV